MEEQIEQKRLAVLIDGDNARASLLSQVLEEVSKFGLITIKRIYGDWTTTNMNSWKDELHKHAIQPEQQFRYTVGKNATDSAMIIDAMDLLHSGNVDGFCIVSSDSDYTRLATRIREEGLLVLGVGEKKTPEAFINACNQFIYSENLVEPERPKKRVRRKGQPKVPDPNLLLLKGFELAAKDEEWVYLSMLGTALHQVDPAFDPRNYGHKQLQSLVKSFPETFTLRLDESRTPPGLYVSLTPRK
jgi:uncharacterized protein (TIGR00288 family)